MKNFRKVLALVLVVATLFSFASMAGAKSLADYTDAADVTTANYEFAVDVLSGLEILNGYEDDTFKPTNTITRAEMAKMIAVLANAGDENVDKLYAAACDFADVDKVNDWFASYVSYCAYTGIVAGRSATTFDPYGKVTGLETAKMLLVVMGMDAAEQGYVGANWKINVLRDAENFGLLDGFAAGYEVDEVITREEAAMMMLNALKAQVIVGVLSENIVKITNARYDTYAGITLKDAEHDGLLVRYGNVIVAPVTLAEALYEGRLDVKFERDCYGRPATQWVLTAKNGKVIFEGVLLTAAMKTSDYTGEIDLDEVLEDEIKAKYNLVAYRNGEVVRNYGPMGEFTDFSEWDVKFGKGVLVEVYVEDNGSSDDKGNWTAKGEVTIVIIDTKIGTIEKIDMADNEVQIAGREYTNEWGFTKDDIDSVVLYWPCGDDDGMHNVEIVEPTVAVVTASTIDAATVADSTFVADGKTYEYSYNYIDAYYGKTNAEKDRFGVKTEIYTDKYGYVMDVAIVDTKTAKVAVVLGDTWVSTDDAVVGGEPVFLTNTADFIYFQEDTTAETVDTTWTFNNSVINASLANKNFDNLLLSYKVDEDGEISAEVPAYSDYSAKGLVLKKGKNVVTAYGAEGEEDQKITNKTKIIIRVPNYTDADVDYDYKYFEGKNALDASYKADSFQYFASSDNRYFTYIYMDATYAVESNRAFILKQLSYDLRWSDGSGLIGGEKFDAVVNGEKAVVVYDKEAGDAIRRWIAGGNAAMVETNLAWVGKTIDGINVWADVNPDSNADLGICTECELKIVGGTMTWICAGECGNHNTVANLKGADITEDTIIVVAWPTKTGYTFEKISEEDFYEYCKDYGWSQLKVYAQFTGETCDELILIAQDTYDVADGKYPEDTKDSNLP